MQHPHEEGVAGGAAHYRPHAVHVNSECPDGPGRAAACTGRLDQGHVKRKDLLQDATGSVAVQFVFHHTPPVGPKRSVLMRVGSYPNDNKPAACMPFLLIV
jgi:hypothetical protein